MKKLLCACAVLLYLLPGCKKSSSEPKLGDGNFVQINNDRRKLGFIPSEDINLFNPPQSQQYLYQVVIMIKNRTDNIDGQMNSCKFENLQMSDNYTATASANLVFYE
jgi:hypothetical protein